VERNAGEDRCSNGAHCPLVSVVLGCVIDIGESACGSMTFGKRVAKSSWQTAWG